MTTLLPAMASVLLFPLAPELWRQGPLTGDTYKVPIPLVSMSDTALGRQLILFRQLESPAMRSRMALELGAVNHDDMFSGLLKLLQSEKDGFVRDDLLKALSALHDRKQSKKVDGAVFESCFKASSPSSRLYAMKLYLTCGQGASGEKVLSVLGDERSPFVLNGLMPVMVQHLESISAKSLLALHEQSSGNLVLRCFVLELMGLKGDASCLPILQKEYEDANPLVRRQVVWGVSCAPGFGNDLLQAGAKDQDSGVRLSVAKLVCNDAVREQILVDLLSDSSASVRAAAALGLGTHGRLGRAAVLATHLDDSDIVVRRAVADGLAMLKPSREIRNDMIALADGNPVCRRQAVRFFHALADRVAAPDIHRWLKESSDDLLTEESIRALGLLDYKPSAEAVAARGVSKNEHVRMAVADTLGTLNIPSSFGMLKRLGRDGLYGVANHAAMAMYVTGNACFKDDYCRFLAGRSETGGECRAIALRGLAALKFASEKTVSDAKALATEACIIMPMAGPMPDLDYVRVSSLLYLYELGKLKQANAQQVFEEVMNEMLTMDESGMLMNEDVKELVLQVDALRQGKPMPKKEIKSIQPTFSCQPLE